MKGYRANSAKRLHVAMILALGMGITNSALAAVGLGPIQVNSYMGNPLNANIHVSGMSAEQAAGATVALANSAEYQRRGVVRTPEQSSLGFSLKKSNNGYVIVVSSTKKINEPFVNFVLTMKSGGQSFSREYSVFLDPDPAAVAGITPVVVEPTTVTKTPPIKIQNTAQTPVEITLTPESETVNVNSQRESVKKRHGSNVYGPVKRGETLFSIANAIRPSNVSAATMQRALYNTNRRAFARNNMSSLMSGTMLTIPKDINAAAAMSPEKKKKKNKHEEAAPVRPQKKEHTDKNVTDDNQQVLPPKSESEISKILDDSQSSEVRPAEMPEAEDNQAESKTEEMTNTDGQEQVSHDNHGMKLEDVASIDSSEDTKGTDDIEKDARLSENKSADAQTSEQVATQEQNVSSDKAETIAAPVEKAEEKLPEELPKEGEHSTDVAQMPKTVEPIKVAENSANESQPAKEQTPSVQSPKVVAKTPTESQPVAEESGLPFGLKMWQILAALGGVLLLLVLALVAKYFRKTPKVELTDAEIDELVKNTSHSDIDDFDLKLVTDNPEAKDTQELPSHEQATAIMPQAESEPFFEDETVLEPSKAQSVTEDSQQFVVNELDDVDDFFSETPISSSEQEPEPASEQVEETLTGLFDDSDDLFVDFPLSSGEQSEKEFTEFFANSDNFFTDAEAQPMEHREPSFEEVELFTDAFESQTTQKEKTQPAVSTMEENQSENFFVNDFFAENVEPTAEKKSEQKEENIPGLEEIDFFAENLSPEVKLVDTASTAAQDDVVKQELSQLTSVPEPTATSIQAMDINLDLAAAYVKSGIKPEKARKWLEEVLEKGTEEQRNIAENLLKQLP